MTILVIDDDPTQLELMKVFCDRIPYPKTELLCAESALEGIRIAKTRVLDLVLTDLRLGEANGTDVLDAVKLGNPLVPVIVMTAFDDARDAVRILKRGADDYLVKPFDKEVLERILIRVNEKNVLIQEAFLPAAEGIASSPAAEGIIYRSAAMAEVIGTAARCADSSATVLITGESGTGKELLSRFIHDRGARKNGPFVAVNISALPEALTESELFGHKRGAFTGADADRIGRFEEADGGTLFIDEVGEISASLQVKLLRAIQFGVIERVGENRPRKLNVRIIAATNRDLLAMVRGGSFRQDLYYRLAVIELTIPPLRSRKEDIRPLLEFFIEKFNSRDSRSVLGVSREAMDTIMKRRFPGNVRELENMVERAVVLCRGDVIMERDLPPSESSDGEDVDHLGLDGDYETAMKTFERALIEKALSMAGGNKSAAARSLGIGERHLRSRLERLDLLPDRPQ